LSDPVYPLLRLRSGDPASGARNEIKMANYQLLKEYLLRRIGYFFQS
jgi:hypothetical protein